MKFLRVGKPGREKPACLDRNGEIRDLSLYIRDFDSNTLNLNVLNKVKNLFKKKQFLLPKIKKNIRIGPCVSKPGKFIGIGLNYFDHAEETGMTPPKEPIIFLKTDNSVSGPYDNVIIPKNSKKTDWEVELGIIIGKKTRYIPKKKSYVQGIGPRQLRIGRGCVMV